MKLFKSTMFVMFLLIALAFATVTTAPSKAQDGDELIEFTSGDVRFVYPADFATSISEIPIDAFPYNPDDGFPLEYYNPLWTRYYFEGYTIPDEFFGSFINLFSTGDFEDYTIRDGETAYGYGVELEKLTALLEEQPDLDDYTITVLLEASDDALTLPNLPYGGETPQTFRSHAEYIPFDDGWGVRYLVYYAYPSMDNTSLPIVEHDIRYTFQGVSNDGSTYVTVSFGIATGLFPLEVESAFDNATFNTDYQAYLEEALTALNALEPDQFNPSLETLDNLVLSLSVNGTIDYDPSLEATEEPSGE